MLKHINESNRIFVTSCYFHSQMIQKRVNSGKRSEIIGYVICLRNYICIVSQFIASGEVKVLCNKKAR